jgi:D-alanyl-D-alanine carboxypeptidase
MKLKNIFFTLFFLCAFVLPSGGQSHFIKAKEDSLLSLLEQNNKAMGSLAVMDKGKIIYARAIGHAGITPEKKVSDEKTRYRIGSISKMFTATLVFQLIEENKLELSATLDKFFPSVRNAEKITIGNLMNHRSGIHNFTNDAAYNTYMTKMKTKSEMIGIISANAPDFEPGDRYEYSNSNYVLLGYIVEDLRKESYENVLQKYICSRAGLSDTHYGGNTDLSKNESYSFRYVEGWVRQPETDMSIPHGKVHNCVV